MILLCSPPLCVESLQPKLSRQRTITAGRVREASIILPARFDIREVKCQKHPKRQLKVKPVTPRERQQQQHRQQSLRPIGGLRDADVYPRQRDRSNGYYQGVWHIVDTLLMLCSGLCIICSRGLLTGPQPMLLAPLVPFRVFSVFRGSHARAFPLEYDEQEDRHYFGVRAADPLCGQCWQVSNCSRKFDYPPFSP